MGLASPSERWSWSSFARAAAVSGSSSPAGAAAADRARFAGGSPPAGKRANDGSATSCPAVARCACVMRLAAARAAADAPARGASLGGVPQRFTLTDEDPIF